MNNQNSRGRTRSPEVVFQHRVSHRAGHNETRKGERPLSVIKFGGTSVADASCISRVVEIIRLAAEQSDTVVVVSAMAGVTNKLIEAATHSQKGNYELAAKILEEISNRHHTALNSLIESADERNRLGQQMQVALEEGDRLCRGTMLLGELSPRVKDLISSLGERLCAPLVASALAQRGVPSQAINATKLIVTDSYHGGAVPWMELTRQRCETHLRPLISHGLVPVVTGFIGANEEGVLTTLGRGGSDYSATILAAALTADEVEIWTDVDGLLTADPRLVPGARTIPEISYREAAELAYFGARVLHPKTLRALMDSGIPVCIRNTFLPQQPGTRITKTGPSNKTAARALTAVSEAALISLTGPAIATAPDVLARVFAAASAAHADVLMILQSSAQNDICVAVQASRAKETVEVLRHEFAVELAHDISEQVIVDETVAIVSVIGEDIRKTPGAIGRLFGALGRENINLIAVAQGPADCKTSFAVARKDLNATLLAAYRELHVEATNFPPNSINPPTRPDLWYSDQARPCVEAD